MVDELSKRFENLLDGTYDCVDRIVLNGFNSMCHSPGGFRTWWRRLFGSDETLDNTHLMRLAGRFSRRVRAFATANSIPVIDCKKGERKGDIAQEYLATHEVGTGVFMILIARAKAPVWDITHCADGRIRDIKKKTAFINHYSFHIMDPEWGHITIKIPGHPPYGAQIILNGHEYVGAQARKEEITFTKESNCFTDTTSARSLAAIADTLSQPEAIGRLVEVCERWIYSSCLCFGLDLAEQEQSGFRYSFSVYQVEYSRNLLFHLPKQMETTFDVIAHRSFQALDVNRLKTLFGAKTRPRITTRRAKTATSPRLGATIETPTYDLTIFKVHFGNLTLKAYTKGERVLRFEAVCHNAKDLRCGRVIDRFGDIVEKLQAMLERFMETLDCVDASFIGDTFIDELPQPVTTGKTRIGGIDINKPRLQAALRAAVALTPSPGGFTVGDFTSTVRSLSGQTPEEYSVRRGAYDLKKLRAKNLVVKIAKTNRYEVPLSAARSITALLTLREHVIKPILAGVNNRTEPVNKPLDVHPIDRHYEQIRNDMQDLFKELGIAA